MYKEVLKNSKSLKARWNLFRSGVSVVKHTDKAAMPFKLKLESSTKCNLDCLMCPNDTLDRLHKCLSFKEFKEIYNQIKPSYLNLTGIGEPLLNEDIFDIIKYARKKSFVKLDTNGTLLTDEIIKKLLDSNPNVVSISLDGMTKETYEGIRKGANFEIVINNIKKIAKAQRKTKIHLFMVVQKDNMDELIDYIKFGDEIGVDSINATFVTELGKNKNIKNSLDNISRKRKKEIYEEILKLDIKTNLWMDDLIEYLGGKTIIKVHCYLPWYTADINVDGTLVPCCFISNQEIVIGNIFETPFKKLWNSERMNKFRQNNKVYGGVCSSCTMDEKFIYERIPGVLR